MKRNLIALIIISALALSSYAQQKPFVFGFKAGGNIGWMKPDVKEYDSDGAKGGFSWGFIADFVLMENYSIVTGFDVVFLNGGLSMPDSIDGQGGTLVRKYKTKYIQIPLMFKMRTNEMGKLRIYGQIGLGTNFLIGAKADDEFTPDGGNAVSDEDVDIYDEMTFMRESLILGAGVEFNLGSSTNLIAGITYNNGFIDVLNGENNRYSWLNNKAYSNYVSLDIGIVF